MTSSERSADDQASPHARPETVGDVMRRLGPAGLIAGFACVAPAIGGFILLARLDAVATWLHELGPRAPLVYAGGFALLAGLALLPTYAQAILGGWTFGFAIGFSAAWMGFVGGAIIGYAIAARASGDRVTRLLAENPRWQAVRDALIGSGFWRTLGLVALIRLPPNSPFAVTNVVLASARTPRVPFILGTLLGMAPRTAVAVSIAAALAERWSTLSDDVLKQARPTWMLIAGPALAIVVMIVIGVIANRAIAKISRPEAQADPAQLDR